MLHNNMFLVLVSPKGIDRNDFTTFMLVHLGAIEAIQYTNRINDVIRDKGKYLFLSQPRNTVLYNHPYRVLETMGKDYIRFLTKEQVDCSDYIYTDVDGAEMLKKRYNGKKRLIVVLLKDTFTQQYISHRKHLNAVNSIVTTIIEEIVFRNANTKVDYVIKNCHDDRERFHKLMRILSIEEGKV